MKRGEKKVGKITRHLLLSNRSGSGHTKRRKQCGSLERSSQPLTGAEALRADEEAAGIHTSASDAGGTSSTSMLCVLECLLLCLDCPEWPLVLEPRSCQKQSYTVNFLQSIWTANSCYFVLAAFTSGASGFLHSDISLDSNSSALSRTSLKGVTSPPITL